MTVQICQPGLIALIAQYASIVRKAQYICLSVAYEMWKIRVLWFIVAHTITEDSRRLGVVQR